MNIFDFNEDSPVIVEEFMGSKYTTLIIFLKIQTV